MEGTVTISLEDFKMLERKAEKLETIRSFANASLVEGNGDLKLTKALKDYLVDLVL